MWVVGGGGDATCGTKTKKCFYYYRLRLSGTWPTTVTLKKHMQSSAGDKWCTADECMCDCMFPADIVIRQSLDAHSILSRQTEVTATRCFVFKSPQLPCNIFVKSNWEHLRKCVSLAASAPFLLIKYLICMLNCACACVYERVHVCAKPVMFALVYH